MTELQNERMTDMTKTICPPIFDLRGINRTTKDFSFGDCKVQDAGIKALEQKETQR